MQRKASVSDVECLPHDIHFLESGNIPDLTAFLLFGLVALGMALTPGPNTIYLISHSISQGCRTGFISLGDVAVGFLFYMLCAAFGITAFVFAMPFTYDALRFGAAAYLLYLARQAVKPGGRSAFAVRNLPVDGPRKLFLMVLITNLANPKIAVMYLSLLPQFITPGHGSVLIQSLLLGSVQLSISLVVNAAIVVMARSIMGFLANRPGGWRCKGG